MLKLSDDQVATPGFMKHWHPAETDLSRSLEHVLLTHRRARPAGSILSIEGGTTVPIVCVLSGWISAAKTMNCGHRQIIDVALPGEVIDTASADTGTSMVEVEALSDVVVAIVSEGVWKRLANELPQVRMMMERNAVAATGRIYERMLRLGKGGAENRIAFALCELWIRSSAAGLVDGARFHVPMTQQQLGDFTGLSSVHVCRTLRRLQCKGIISINHNMNIHIREMDDLTAIAEIDLATLHCEIIPDTKKDRRLRDVSLSLNR